MTVFAGRLGVTLFRLFLTPVFYVALQKLGSTVPGHPSTVGHPGVDGEHS